MAGLGTALKQGLSATIGAFRRIYGNPTDVEGGSVVGQQPYYSLLWAYYENSAFENVGLWAAYRGQNRLYRAQRMLYNPTKRLCDFYSTHLYPGLLAANVTGLPDGTTLAIPLSDDTPPEVRTGLDQLWAWSRWQSNKSLLGRYGSVAGSVLIEAVDDIDAGRVYMNVVWPALITYLDLDPTGVILAYVLQYPARDAWGNYYLFRKEVDAQEIRFYKNDALFDYGEGASYANPYGFVPAVWIKHKDLGGNTGAPAIHGVIGKVDELNSLASHIHDQVHKVIGAPVVMWSKSGIASLTKTMEAQQRPSTNPYQSADLDREGLLMLTGPEGGRVDHLAGNLQLHEAAEHMQMLMTEIEADCPEVTMYRQLRSMSQVTGPAATRLMGDVVNNVDEAAANYDDGCRRMFAMCLAIGGWRATSGAWGGMLDLEQRSFLPFTLDQYKSNELLVRIMPRPLIAMNEIERLELEQLRDTVKAGVLPTLTGNVRETIAG
jgi:hypothetical protein